MILVIRVTDNLVRRVVSRPPGTDAAFRALGACPKVVEPVFPAWPFPVAEAKAAVLDANSKRARRIAHFPSGGVGNNLERRTYTTTSRTAPGQGA